MNFYIAFLASLLIVGSDAFSLPAKTNIIKHEEESSVDMNRRLVLLTTLSMPVAGSILFQPKEAMAIDTQLLDIQAKKFRKAPCFAIVNGKTGVPFMILRNTGLATTYFFTSYEGAQLVLEDARRDAKEKDLDTRKFWDDAKISATSMEFALKLSKGRPRAMAQNNQKYETVYDIIPTLKALDDAGRIDKSGIFNEQGRVPLFYMNELRISPEVEGGEKRIPVFFEKSELVKEWQRRNPDASIPAVKVVDLVDTFTAMIGMGSSGSTNEEVTKNLYVVASPDAKSKAIECEKARGDVPAFKTGEMIAVGGKD